MLEPKSKEDEVNDKQAAEDSQQLPPLARDQLVSKRAAEIKQASKTSPPKPYDDASLLTAMKNAGQQIDDEDLAAYMKQSGLGTPATRAAIIERLVQSGYVERKKKIFLPTEKGKALIGQVHPDLKDIALTASWEQRLANIQEGKLAALTTFENDIAGFVCRILPAVASSTAPMPAIATPGLGACPQCRQGTIQKTPKGAGCNRWKDGCTFSIWREQHGKQLTDTHIIELLEKRRTKVIKGFKKKLGEGTYDAHLILTDEFKVRLEFDNQARAQKQA